ncbi:MAG TPA: amidohydrolase family protein [candidate division Zixibacteria bacterium]|nr:amidohydrolase family protein [candidate division Zixibacteria bacterium]
MAHDLVIRDGTVVDGTGGPAFEADIAIDGENITAIGKNLGKGAKEIDARGKVVAPGFIDAHTHMDAFVVQYPHGNPVVNYGVTTIVIGDCGASCAPVPPRPEPRQVLVQYLRRVLDKYVDDKDWKWSTFPDYLNYLEGNVAVNVAALMPHSPVRLTVMGEAAYAREATAEELETMKRMVREGMEAGAVGFSTSPRGGPAIHAGTPSTFATHDEIVELANVAGEFNGCFQFNGFGMILKPETGVPAMLERIRATQIGNEFRIRPGEKEDGPKAIRYMAEAQKRGQNIYGVVIPYQHIRRFTVRDCFILNGLPAWEAIKGAPDLGAQLRQSDIRRRLEQERTAGAGKPEFPEWHGWERVVFERLEKPELKKLELKNVVEIARLTEKPPVDAFFDTWLEDDLRSRCVYYGLANAHMELLADMIKSHTSLIGTDVGAHLDRFFWHGAPAKVLGYWRREKNLFNLEQAVHKLTGFPAERLRLNRGLLKPAMPADVTVFDADRIDDLVSERLPEMVDAQEVKRHPPGIKAVVVNGQVVVEDGCSRDVFPGRVRRQQICRPH